MVALAHLKSRDPFSTVLELSGIHPSNIKTTNAQRLYIGRCHVWYSTLPGLEPGAGYRCEPISVNEPDESVPGNNETISLWVLGGEHHHEGQRLLLNNWIAILEIRPLGKHALEKTLYVRSTPETYRIRAIKAMWLVEVLKLYQQKSWEDHVNQLYAEMASRISPDPFMRALCSIPMQYTPRRKDRKRKKG